MTFLGCKPENKKTVHQHTQEAVTTLPNTKASESPQIGSQVPTEQVCMVNDAYMGKLQIPVPVNGKTYYGCCQMCVKTLNEHDEARTALDPFSKQRVDKTEAFIVLMGMDGKVAYFESEENFLKFKEVGRMNH